MMMDQKNQLGPEQKEKKLDSTELSGPKKHGAPRGARGVGGDTVSSEMRA